MKQNDEHRNLSQNTANCDKFTLSPSETEIIRGALQGVLNLFGSQKGPVDAEVQRELDVINEVINRIDKYENENDILDSKR